MEKSKAAEMATVLIAEALKGGAIAPTTTPHEDSGKCAADFIISAHKHLSAYCETLE